MTHGDDQGLRLPPRLAPIQMVIVPIWRKDEQRGEVMEAVASIRRELEGQVRIHVDDSDQRPGWKFHEWEMRGVPLRLEIGPRDVAANTVVLVRRDTGDKETAARGDLQRRVVDLLDDVQRELFDQAHEHARRRTSTAGDYETLKALVAEGGFVKAYWDGSTADEERIQDECGATVRCIPFEQPEASGACVYTGRETSRMAVFARAY
jgi:prolyl-tRNA synthetase